MDLAHFFIPKTSNNYKAKILHLSSLILLTLLVIFFQSTLTLGSVSNFKILGYKANISPEEVIRLTNEMRQERGLPALREDKTLVQAALAKGMDMLNNDYWAHVSPNGAEPWTFFVNAGYKYRYAGENLARDFSNSHDVVAAWMASPSHRENLLSAKYRDIGIAVVEGELGGVETAIIVQLFGTRSGDLVPSLPIAAAEENEVIEVIEEEVIPPPKYVAMSSVKDITVTSPFQLTKIFSIILASIFLTTMILDGIIIKRKGIYRIGGRTFAHISFMGMVLAIIFIIRSGQIF